MPRAMSRRFPDLGHCFWSAMGAKISGLGSTRISTVEGVVGAARHRTPGDARPHRARHLCHRRGHRGAASWSWWGRGPKPSPRSPRLLNKSGAEVAQTARGMKVHMNGCPPACRRRHHRALSGFSHRPAGPDHGADGGRRRHLGDPRKDLRKPLHACARAGPHGRAWVRIDTAIPRRQCAAWKSSRARR